MREGLRQALMEAMSNLYRVYTHQPCRRLRGGVQARGRAACGGWPRLIGRDKHAIRFAKHIWRVTVRLGSIMPAAWGWRASSSKRDGRCRGGMRPRARANRRRWCGLVSALDYLADRDADVRGGGPWRAALLPPATRRQIRKPSARVSFGLPDPLSFQVRSHAMVARRSGTNTRQGKRQGQAAKQPDPRLGNAMRTSQNSWRKTAKANGRLPMCPRHCRWPRTTVNMVAFTAVSGAVLLVLLAARHF